MSRCDAIAEALVMGESLSEGDQAHLEDCAACRRLTALPGLLAASASAEPPRPGFSARMMAAARERISQRRRRRFATFTLALAAAGASAVAVDRGFIRSRSPTAVGVPLPPMATAREPSPEEEPSSISGFDHAMAPVADWDAIEAPVHKYRVVLRTGGLK